MKFKHTLLACCIAATGLGAWVATAQAAAPMVKTQAPGYYRMMLGDFEVTAVSDGVVALPFGKLLTNTSPQRVDQLLKRAFLSDPLPTAAGYAVLRVLEKTPFDAAAFALQKDSIATSLEQQQKQRLFQSYVDSVRERFKVERYPDAMKRVGS